MNELRPIGTRFNKYYCTYNNDYTYGYPMKTNERHYKDTFEVMGYETDSSGRKYEVVEHISHEEIRGY